MQDPLRTSLIFSEDEIFVSQEIAEECGEDSDEERDIGPERRGNARRSADDACHYIDDADVYGSDDARDREKMHILFFLVFRRRVFEGPMDAPEKRLCNYDNERDDCENRN